jgi:hypothetical protein
MQRDRADGHLLERASRCPSGNAGSGLDNLCDVFLELNKSTIAHNTVNRFHERNSIGFFFFLLFCPLI